MKKFKNLTEKKFKFSEHEKELLQKGVLYINYDIRSKSKSEFIINELLDIAFKYFTYHDEDCKNIQCCNNCFRSIGDLFRITKRYFDDITLKEFCEIFWFESFHSSHFCFDIEKRVYYSREKDERSNIDHAEECAIEDEFGWFLYDVFQIDDEIVD
jgi:hypothetical protein